MRQHRRVGPAVRTPNIRTRINQIWLAGTEDDPGHEASTAADHHALEAVAMRVGGNGCRLKIIQSLFRAEAKTEKDER